MTEITGPVTGGRHGWPFGAAAFDLAALGYVEEEFFFGGEAARYRHAPGTGRSVDGKWSVERLDSAPYRSRMLVRRPADPARFNGTVVVLWNNVSLGFDIFAGESPEIYRGGFAIALVSAQRVGVHGFPATPERAVVGWDTERYGALHIPSDEFSFDIYGQAARLLGPDRPRTPVDAMGGLRVRKLVASGASQSAVRLATYLNALHATERIFDAFYLHVYFGNGASLEEPPFSPITRVEDIMPLALKMPAGSHLLRDDLGVPVMVMNSETESTLHYPVRQPDTDTFCFWEVAGVGHGCARGSDFLKSSWPRDLGIDRHPMAPLANNNFWSHEPVNSAALTHIQRWLTDGVPPPVQPRLTFAGDPPRLQRNALGIAEGGIRLPQIEVPSGRHTGVDADGLLQMFGETRPFPEGTLARTYGDAETYARRLRAAADDAVAKGVLLSVDREPLIGAALREFAAAL
jgi:hypothetical protein